MGKRRRNDDYDEMLESLEPPAEERRRKSKKTDRRKEKFAEERKWSFDLKPKTENQRLAMDAFTKKGGEPCFFALKFPDCSIRILGYGRLKTLESRGIKSITPKMMDSETWLFDDWLESVNVWAEGK